MRKKEYLKVTLICCNIWHCVGDMGCLPFLKLVPLLVLSSGISLSWREEKQKPHFLCYATRSNFRVIEFLYHSLQAIISFSLFHPAKISSDPIYLCKKISNWIYLSTIYQSIWMTYFWDKKWKLIIFFIELEWKSFFRKLWICEMCFRTALFLNSH